jgi:hypothetical protein
MTSLPVHHSLQAKGRMSSLITYFRTRPHHSSKESQPTISPTSSKFLISQSTRLGDPIEHLENFRAHLNLHGTPDEVA